MSPRRSRRRHAQPSRDAQGSQHARTQNNPEPRIARASLAGKIQWLPKKEDIHLPVEIEEGCFNHPVVVLWPVEEDSKVMIFIITSLGGSSLDKRFPSSRQQHARSKYLPIQPAAAHPDSEHLLELRTGEMNKACYVSISARWKVDHRVLRRYGRGDHSYFLNDESYATMISLIENITPSRALSTVTAPTPSSPVTAPTYESSYSSRGGNSVPAPASYPTSQVPYPASSQILRGSQPSSQTLPLLPTQASDARIQPPEPVDESSENICLKILRGLAAIGFTVATGNMYGNWDVGKRLRKIGFW